MPSSNQLRPGLLVAALLTASVFSPIRARADVSLDQANQLEAGLRAWLGTLLGPNVTLAERPIRVAPEGDHYRLSIEVAGRYGDGIMVSADPISALVMPIDGTRWAVDDIRIPSPLRIENTGSGSDRFKSMATKIADQSGKGVVDLSYATTSTIQTTLRGYTSLSEGANGTQTTHVESYISHTTWQPTGTGRLNILADGAGQGISADSVMQDGTPVKLTARSFQFTGHADNVAMDQAATMIRSATDLIPIFGAERAAKAAVAQGGPDTSKPGTSKPGAAHGAENATDDAAGLSPAARISMRALLAAASGVMDAMEEQYTLTDVAFHAAGHAGTVGAMTMGLGVGAPDGRVDVHMLMTLDGLDSPEIPAGVFHDFLPKHLSIKPRISGVPSADVVKLLNHAIDSDGHEQAALSAEALGLLAKGPLSIGIDDLALDAGPAVLKGSGTLQVTDPQTIAGAAQLRVTGYDALTQQINSTPILQSGAPVLIFLKGIGKQDGDAVVWNIAYQDHKLLVNGTDLSALIPSDNK